MKKIFFIHLNNNFSGSPNVLANVINTLDRSHFDITLITSYTSHGFLSNIKNVKKMNVFYRFYKNKLLRLLFFFYFQFLSTIKVLVNSNKGDIVYLNTFHPFLAAIFCKISKRKIIYHIHEYFPNPNFFQFFLFKIVELTSHKIICVSNCVSLQFKNVPYKVEIVYNTLSQDFISNSLISEKTKGVPKEVLMVSTLREYKGVFMFCKIALCLPYYNFTLIISEKENIVKNAFSDFVDVPNLRILPLQTNLHKYYLESDLILNLTDYTKVIETFGLSILEAMYYGIPGIVPPYSGVTELIFDNYNGKVVDTLSQNDLINSICYIFDANNYSYFSNNSLHRFSSFHTDKFEQSINNILK